MLEYQITSFRSEHLIPAVQLFTANYEIERNKVPALPPVTEIVKISRALIGMQPQ